MRLGRRTPPAITKSPTPLSRSSLSPCAAAPILHHAWDTPMTVSGAASPSSASTNTSRPLARQISTRRRGSSPPPAITPSLAAVLPAIRPLRLADRPARIRTDEGDEIVDRTNAAEPLRDFLDPLAKRAGIAEQAIIGAAQALDIVTAKAAALHADDVEPMQPRPIAHHLAIGDDIA